MKKFLAISAFIALFTTSLILPASASIKAGATCKTKGQIKTESGYKFTCLKSGKKLTWSKGISISNSVQSLVYAPPTQLSSDLELCKIKENNDNRRRWLDSQLATGFPSVTNATKLGTVKWALIPIEFPDLPGDSNFRTRVDGQMKLLSDWFATVSDRKFKVEWVVSDKWVKLPKSTNEYEIGRSDNLDRVPNGLKLFNDAMTESDKTFDFTGIQTVNFVLPLNQNFMEETLQGFPWDSGVKNFVTNEGRISSFSIPGKFMTHPLRQYWSYWAHEFGHAMALPHIGSSREENPFMGLDLMGVQDGESRELSGWIRFVAGWLDDQKVYCQEFSKLSSTEISLVPLNESKDGFKLVVIPISETKAVILESRRETKFSCKMPSKRNGVLAYLYDATKSHGENFLKPVTPEGRKSEYSYDCITVPSTDSILYKGDKVTFEGISIEILDIANYDKVKISLKG